MADIRPLRPDLPASQEEATEMTLDILAREGARKMIAAALEAEVAAYIDEHVGQLDQNGHRVVVRNGKAKERRLTVGSGAIGLKAPRVDDKRIDKDGNRRRFSSKILPRWARRSPKVGDVLPILYLRGLSTGDFEPALRDFFGEGAKGLSPATISRLTAEWQKDFEAFQMRRFDFSRYAYMWADGVHVKVRLGEDDRLCLLVVIGVREDGQKELLAVDPGYRESTESWGGVLRDLQGRGVHDVKLTYQLPGSCHPAYSPPRTR